MEFIPEPNHLSSLSSPSEDRPGKTNKSSHTSRLPERQKPLIIFFPKRYSFFFVVFVPSKREDPTNQPTNLGGSLFNRASSGIFPFSSVLFFLFFFWEFAGDLKNVGLGSKKPKRQKVLYKKKNFSILFCVNRRVFSPPVTLDEKEEEEEKRLPASSTHIASHFLLVKNCPHLFLPPRKRRPTKGSA